MGGKRLVLATLLLAGMVAGVLLWQDGRVRADSYKDGYSFPIKPGTAEWAGLKNHDAMLAAAQIPPDTLTQLSTPSLLDIVLDYPLYGDMLAYDSIQLGYEQVAGSFNGLGELMGREDVATVLLERYGKMDALAIDPAWTLEEIGNHDRQFTYIEALLAQPEVTRRLSVTQQHDLLALLWATAQKKSQRADVYGFYGLQSSAWVAGRLLAAMGQLSAGDFAVVQGYLDTGLTDEAAPVEAILERLGSYLGKEEAILLPISLAGEARRGKGTS